MNCQITKLYDKYMDLEIVSSKTDSCYSLLSIVCIGSNDYLENGDIKNSKTEDFFGKIVEIGTRFLKLELLKPQLLFVGKIIKIDPIQTKINFLPNLLNNRITLGEYIISDTKIEPSYEFIPTVQVGESVIQGQKIGYLNINSGNSTQNSKFWILSTNSGNVDKIVLGDFKFGNNLAVIDKQNIILGSGNLEVTPGDLLLKIQNNPDKIDLVSSECKLDISMPTSTRNIVIDTKKQFLNNIHIDTEKMSNCIFIFVTQDSEFKADNRYNSITLFDKYRFGYSIKPAVNDLTLAICESGQSVVLISNFDLKIDTIGQYKTINGEEVAVTSILCAQGNDFNPKYFGNSIILD
jgi:hypothetical protein